MERGQITGNEHWHRGVTHTRAQKGDAGAVPVSALGLAPPTYLESSFAPGVQGSLVEQVEIRRVTVPLVLFSGFFHASKALEQSCFQGTYISMKRLEKV